MKGKILLLVFVFLVVLILFGIYLFRSKKEVTIDRMKSFYYTYTSGYAMNAYTRYEIQKQENKWMAIIKEYGKAEEEAVSIAVNDEFIEKIKDIIIKYRVNTWDGFHKNNPNVLDGDSFSLSITMENDESISASGYMRWPKDYGSVKQEINELFQSIYKK